MAEESGLAAAGGRASRSMLKEEREKEAGAKVQPETFQPQEGKLAIIEKKIVAQKTAKPTQSFVTFLR